ncbi:MAG: hypothetical protein HYZ53_25620 [Planctomycetes bacterium]|nr:hypothetical protein [Planctomycetota bacterium]
MQWTIPACGSTGEAIEEAAGRASGGGAAAGRRPPADGGCGVGRSAYLTCRNGVKLDLSEPGVAVSGSGG